MNNNQPGCPPRLTSYDKAQDHKISNQYMNNGHTFYQSYTQNMPLQNPNNVGSVYSINQNQSINSNNSGSMYRTNQNPSINSNNSGSLYRTNQNPSINSNNSGSMYRANQNPSINSNNSGSMYRNQNPSINSNNSGSIYNINQNQSINSNQSINQNQNNYYPPRPVNHSYQPQGLRLNSGDPSPNPMNNYNQQMNNNSQQINNYSQQMNNYNQQINNYDQDQKMNNQVQNYRQSMNNKMQRQSVAPSLDTNNNSDFEINFTEPEKQKEMKFFDITPNIKEISKQNKLSKWTLVFIIFQVISMIVLEALLLINYRYFFNDKLKEIDTDYENQCIAGLKNEVFINNEDCKRKIEGYERFRTDFKQMESLQIYQLIFIVAQIFVLIMYYDSFRISSSIQLIAISIFNFLVAGYSFIQIYQTIGLFKRFEGIKNLDRSSFDYKFTDFDKIETLNLRSESKYKRIIGYEIAITIIIFVSAIGLLIMSLFLFKKLGWNIYRNLGADIKKTVILKRRYNFGIVLKFKYFFLFGIIIQCFVFNNKNEDKEINFSKDIMGSIELIVRSYAAPTLALFFIINTLCGYISVSYML